MQTTTLSDLRSRVRKKLDAENAATPTDAQINGAVNNAIRRLHAKCVQLSEDDFTTSVYIATVANQRYVYLPDDFLVLREIEWLPNATVVPGGILTESGSEILTEDGSPLEPESGGDATITGSDEPYQLDRFKLQDRAKFYGGSWSRGRPIAYRLIGRSAQHAERVELIPTPTGVHTLQVWYAPTAATLSSDTDTYDGRSGFDEWVVIEAALAFAIDEESDVRAWASERERIWDTQIAPLFAVRDQAEPDQIVDATGYFDPTDWDLSEV
jgi:hypothetical protein